VIKQLRDWCKEVVEVRATLGLAITHDCHIKIQDISGIPEVPLYPFSEEIITFGFYHH
jgi:hypothetical protein